MSPRSNSPTPPEMGGAERSPSPPPWHAREASWVLERLQVEPDGLDESEAERRLARTGPNQLSVQPPVSAWAILRAQLASLVVGLLTVAMVVSVVVGDGVEALAIGAVLVLNTALGFWTELRARRAMEALRGLQVQEAVVRRQGRARSIDAARLVPGDLILLEAGAAVPADARLVAGSELHTIEAPLTGESLPVTKAVDGPTGPDAESLPVADRRTMVYKGTLVATGSGEAVVVGTGLDTEVGRIGALLQSRRRERAPLERRLDRLSRRLVGFVLALAALIVGLGLLRGAAFWPMVETGIALAVAAVPEGLPVVATIALAVGLRRMVRRRALLRRLPAVETLGSATVICTDKTGTLTAGEMTATVLYVDGGEIEIRGSGYRTEGELRRDGAPLVLGEGPGEMPELELALRIALLANDARLDCEAEPCRVEGDPTEAALLVLGAKAGLRQEELAARQPRLAEVPFSSERMLMATLHAADEERVAYVKGAPGKILELSSRLQEAGRTRALDDEGRRRLLAVNGELAERGLRVLALATRPLAPETSFDDAALVDLCFVGFVGFMDPPAAGVAETVERLRSAGIRTVMITGDQAITARAIGENLGILRPGEEVLDGREMATLTDEELAQRVGAVAAFARVSPEDKLRIVQALQSRGEVVGMLGDGVNDAPALRQADIGAAMGGRGTDIAKETADMVLVDDRFETVAAAVEEGRVVFDNLRKFVFYLFSCNVSEVWVVALSLLAGLPLPLLPLQILWLNLVTDVFPALALALEPKEPGIMGRPPRPTRAGILEAALLREVGVFALAITAATLGAFQWTLRDSGDLPRAMTVAFMTLALAQLFHVFNARGERAVVFGRRLFTNPYAWGALAITVLLQLAAVYLEPLSRVLRLVPPGPADWRVILSAALLPLLLGQIWKAWRFRKGTARPTLR